ncbi:MAG: hypothetical protein JSU04_16030 [Bdellovibrionales bacterium]|nr:hypothetical protein [Bdellovibrionales bacterium]
MNLAKVTFALLYLASSVTFAGGGNHTPKPTPKPTPPPHHTPPPKPTPCLTPTPPPTPTPRPTPTPPPPTPTPPPPTPTPPPPTPTPPPPTPTPTPTPPVTDSPTPTPTPTSTPTSSPTPTPTPTPDASPTPQDEKKDKELKHKVVPYFFINFDWGNWMANMTPYKSLPPAPVEPAALLGNGRDRMVVNNFRDGVQKTGYGFLVGGFGAKMTWWYDNASGVAKQWWAYVGIAPLIGRQMNSVRYYRTYDEADKAVGYRSVPSTAKSAGVLSQGDSVTYLSTGGLIFSAGTGLNVVGVGATAIAQGTWETYIEKVDNEHVYVKLTKGKLTSFSVSTGVAIVQVSETAFRNSDDGFSYLYNLSTEVGRKAYEDVIRGNVIASDQISKSRPRNLVEKAPVLKVATFTNLNTGRFLGVSMGLPIIWNSAYTKGNINSYSTTDFHINNKTARVHYGIYSETKNFQLWNRHRETDLMFYGAKYTINSPEGNEDGSFGRYSYAYRNEHATPRRLNKSIAGLIQHTGIDDLSIDVPDDDKLGYAGVEFNTTLSEDNTKRLMAAAQKYGDSYFINIADRYYNDYRHKGDVYNNCLGPATPICWNYILDETHAAMRDMRKELIAMIDLRAKDPKAYAAAYGRFGEAMTKNHMTYRAALEIAGPGIEISYLVEGAKISMYYKAWRTTRQPNQWDLTDDPNAKEGAYPFEPRLRHSQIQGLIVNPGLGGIETFSNLTTLEPEWSFSTDVATP